MARSRSPTALPHRLVWIAGLSVLGPRSAEGEILSRIANCSFSSVLCRWMRTCCALRRSLISTGMGIWSWCASVCSPETPYCLVLSLIALSLIVTSSDETRRFACKSRPLPLCADHGCVVVLRQGAV